METDHTETVVDKAVAYVKDFFGVPPGDRTPDVEAKPEYADTVPKIASEDALDPDAYTTKSVTQMNAESERREDDKAIDAHMQPDGKKLPSESDMQKAT